MQEKGKKLWWQQVPCPFVSSYWSQWQVRSPFPSSCSSSPSSFSQEHIIWKKKKKEKGTKQYVRTQRNYSVRDAHLYCLLFLQLHLVTFHPMVRLEFTYSLLLWCIFSLYAPRDSYKGFGVALSCSYSLFFSSLLVLILVIFSQCSTQELYSTTLLYTICFLHLIIFISKVTCLANSLSDEGNKKKVREIHFYY